MQRSTKEQLEHITTLHKQIKQKPLKKGKARKTNWMEPLSGRSFCTPTNGETPVSCVAPDPLSGIDPSPAVVCVHFVESSFRTACARPARIFSFTTSDGDEPDLAELATSSTHLVETQSCCCIASSPCRDSSITCTRVPAPLLYWPSFH